MGAAIAATPGESACEPEVDRGQPGDCRVRKTVEAYDPNAGWTPGADTAYVWDGWKLLLEIDLRGNNKDSHEFSSRQNCRC